MTRRAIVIGGSVAGLLAARVLADRFDRVTILDRDVFPEGASFRAGAPQSRHVHQLLLRGLQAFEDIAPGFGDALARGGACAIDVMADIRTFTGDGWAPRAASGLRTYCATRELIESALRARVMSAPNIDVIEGAEAMGLEADGARVRGVHLRWRAKAGQAREDADLVVDASGATSPLTEWLRALGYAAPGEECVQPFLGYASRVYEPPPGAPFDWKALYLPLIAPVFPRGGLIFPIENGRWLVTLCGGSRQYPPVAEEGFLEFARTLAHPALHDALREARPLSKVAGFQRTANHLRRFDRLSRVPEGLIATGDAVATFNPIYGQGMAAAALGALALRDALAQSDPDQPGFALRCHRAIVAVYRGPWLLSTAQDRLFPATEADPVDWSTRAAIESVQRAARNAHGDARSYLQFLRVAHLLEPVESVLSVRARIGATLGRAAALR